jgi:eukaryotic-like serine/threonine-protein kinase
VSTLINAPLPEGLELAGYRIDSRIASGGFSIVYLAHDEDGKPVAIKEYLPASLATRAKGELAPTVKPEHIGTYRAGLRCFFEEGRILAKVFHPNVVKVVNFFRENDTVYMVMNYVTGRSLQELVLKFRDEGQREVLSEPFIRDTFYAAMNGLREVHLNKMLHLDLKPANIYMRRDGSPILLDFGAARTTLTDDHARFFPMYTPGFAPLEMYKKTDIGPWTDIYSVGACMFACMAGIPPQAADSRVNQDKMDAAYRALRGIYSDELISVVRWCMKMNAKDRPQSVYQLQKALKVSEDAPVPKISMASAMWSKALFFVRGGKRAKGIADIRASHEAAHREKLKRAKANSDKSKSNAPAQVQAQALAQSNAHAQDQTQFQGRI